ncbi:dynein regulatory complex subunit 2-like [Coccinella septempunctata]|uniref:dynein regulatory complex subunit 2-like n=1 Tax=Coccinella septempunctata TaxID=41139 RepID=UPI001D08C040|nr:dynein regulatory complex subunit 2-like [Coccinella septempunctata]
MPPKLSKKERKLEKQRKIQEKKCLLLRQYLEREVKYGNVTRKKHEISWRKLVEKIGLEKMRDDLEYTWQLFEWALDIKDCSISALMDELDKSNEQYLMTLQNHNMVIGELLHNMHENLELLNRDFLRSLQNMKDYYNEKNKEYQEKCEEDQRIMKTLLYRMQVDNDKACRDQMTHYFCAMESFISAENQRESNEVVYSKKMAKLWNKSNAALNEHISRSDNYRAKTQKDRSALELSLITIKKNLKKIVYFVDVIKKLQAKLLFLYKTDGENLRNLNKNHEEFTTYLFILKNKLFRDNTLDTNRGKLLVHGCQNTLDHFRKICRKGEMIIRLMSVNRRYETSSEKVLPYPSQDSYRSSRLEIHKGNSLDEKLILFYQKMATVDASRIALVEEKKLLQLERMQIKKKFQDFCECLDCFNKFPRPKREKKLKTFGYFERTEMTTFYGWKHQMREDMATKQKLREIRKKMIPDEVDEQLNIAKENAQNLE